MIFTITIFRNDKSQQIDAYAEYPALLPVYSKFLGHAIGKFDTPMGPQVTPYQFPIDAKSIEEAFERYAECAKIGGQAHQQKIIDDVRRARLAGK